MKRKSRCQSSISLFANTLIGLAFMPLDPVVRPTVTMDGSLRSDYPERLFDFNKGPPSLLSNEFFQIYVHISGIHMVDNYYLRCLHGGFTTTLQS